MGVMTNDLVVSVSCLTMSKEFKIYFRRSCLKQQGLPIVPSTSTGRRAGEVEGGDRAGRLAGRLAKFAPHWSDALNT